jgi:Ca2+-binding EF-hand superfamily protein
MRKILLAAAGFAALAGAAGLALAQDSGPRGRFDIFQADANGDGVLTRQEFDTGREARFAALDGNDDNLLSREEMRAERGHRGRGGAHRGGMHSLARADANNDGNITRDEFLARPNQMFDRMDDNDDGVIAADERPQRGDRAGRRGEGRPSRDADGDGNISRAEFAAMGAHMFERLDANDDGNVTREEAEAARPHRRGRE